MEPVPGQPDPPRKLRFEPPATARPAPLRIRIRLLMLVFCLGGVLLAMRAAGNPNNWTWLTNAGQPAAGQPGQGLRVTEIDPKSGKPVPSANSVQEYTIPNEAAVGPGDDAIEPPLALQPDQSLDELSADFCRRFLQRLDHVSRRNFYRLVFSDHPSSVPAESVANLIERLREYYQGYTAELLSQAGALGMADSPTRQAAYDVLFDWQQQWRDSINPILTAWGEGSAIPIDPQAKLRSLLSGAAQSLVADQTPLPAAADYLFVERLLQQTSAAATPPAQAEPVTHLQLVSQPSAYRGRWVTFSGRIRAARQLTSRRMEEGTTEDPSFYEWWVQPSDGSTIPFCFLTVQWPSALPFPGKTLQPLDQQAQFTGYFYKVRSYLADGGRVQFCPTLIGLVPVLQPTSGGAASPAAWWWLPLLVALGIVCAVAVALRVYRSSRQIGARIVRPARLPADWMAPTDSDREATSNRLEMPVHPRQPPQNTH